ncbi:MAG TPA: pentapeptide repeat-containing protein, partial [Methylomirabilota bacterium]|nr:pentapeptide repeat-containing protein [Methylomirabilota bacterium]
LIILGYIFNWDWTGLNATDFSSTPQNIPKTIVYQPEKTLWDWLQLLIIPAVLAVAGYVINLTISRGEQAATAQRAKSERDAAEKRAETERAIALDNQQEVALQAYIDKISELLLKEHLGELTEDGKLKPEYEQVRNIARVRTLTLLPRLDALRKGSLLLFLQEAGLINKNKCIIDLQGADLRKVDLSLSSRFIPVEAEDELVVERMIRFDSANLKNANLANTNLAGANLVGAFMNDANLRGAFLLNADLSEAFLRDADLSITFLGRAKLSRVHLDRANLKKAHLFGANLNGATGTTPEQLAQAKVLTGATMPDGSIHP